MGVPGGQGEVGEKKGMPGAQEELVGSDWILEVAN
jgi:hypothetical protein